MRIGGRVSRSRGALAAMLWVVFVGAAPSFTRVTLERRPCYGTCPVYLVTVLGDGSVIFEGRAHVDSVGRFTFRLAADRLAELARLVESERFAALDDRYVYGAPGCGPYATDAPTVIVSVT